MARGRSWFAKDEAQAALGLTSSALGAALARARRKGRLANPRHGFYLVLRPEDRVTGAPDPIRWVEPLMKHQQLDYRVALLRAAALHGASHHAAMVFQVIAPKQLRGFELGRHRLVFLYQEPTAFRSINCAPFIWRAKSDAGYTNVAGVELTLLDSTRYFHKAAGLNGVAQIVHDIGGRAKPIVLKKAATAYENSVVRRLGYLLDLVGHRRQADALQHFADEAKAYLPLNAAVKPVITAAAREPARSVRWKLLINDDIEPAE